MSVLVPLVIFFALAVPIAILLWRVFVVGGELRRSAQRARTAVDLARRVDLTLGELLVIVDDLRRRKLAPEAGEASLEASDDALRLYIGEASSLEKNAHGPVDGNLRSELEWAQRAIDLIEHGRRLMLDARPEHLEEGETSIKRGYLNLLHARDAIRATADQIAALTGAGPGTDVPSPRGGA